MKQVFVVVAILLVSSGELVRAQRAKAVNSRAAVVKMSNLAEQLQDGVKAKLIRQIKSMQLIVNLDGAQVRKLEVAAAGAAKKMFTPLHDHFKQLLELDVLTDAEARQAVDLVRNASEKLNAPVRSEFWDRVVSKTLTAEQSAVLELNAQKRDEFEQQLWVYERLDESLDSQKREKLSTQFPDRFAKFRGQLWVHRVVNEMGRMKYQKREAAVAALTKWVAQNGVPDPRPNPRTKSWLDTLPESAMDALSKLP